ncbi:hypothetical protein [Streptomyces chryseus]
MSRIHRISYIPGWNIATGLDADPLDGLVAQIHRELVEDPDSPVVPERMWALGLYRSVVPVLFLTEFGLSG